MPKSLACIQSSDLASQALHSCDVAVSLQGRALLALLWAFEQLFRAERQQAGPARAPVGKVHADATARIASATQRSGQLRPALATADINAGEPCRCLHALPPEGACNSLGGSPLFHHHASSEQQGRCCPANLPNAVLSAHTSCDAERAISLLAGAVKDYRGDLNAIGTTSGQQGWQIRAVHGEGPETHADAAGASYHVTSCIKPTQIPFP